VATLIISNLEDIPNGAIVAVHSRMDKRVLIFEVRKSSSRHVYAVPGTTVVKDVGMIEFRPSNLDCVSESRLYFSKDRWAFTYLSEILHEDYRKLKIV
jgi:hypothetical protein